VTPDSLGFVWIATDAGLVKFNGINFENYSQYVPSQYGKYLLSINQGALGLTIKTSTGNLMKAVVTWLHANMFFISTIVGSASC